MTDLRAAAKDYNFQSINLDYLGALSETHGGLRLVSDLIEIYLERAYGLLDQIMTSAENTDYRAMAPLLLALASGSERIGASRLAGEIGELFDEVSNLMDQDRSSDLLARIDNEFALVKFELVSLLDLMRTMVA